MNKIINKRRLSILSYLFLFQFNLSFAQCSIVYQFGPGDIKNPLGSVTYVGPYLYGMSPSGGVFKVKPDGTGYATVNSNPGGPSSLIWDGTYFYGIGGGGIAAGGTIFKIKPDGTGYSIIHTFNFPIEGGRPEGSPLLIGNTLYCLTTKGGPNNLGSIFKVSTTGTSSVTLLNFSGTVNGGEPRGDLISDGTFLYGLTTVGGVNNQGIIFKIKPDGTSFSKLIDFSGANGANPYGSLFYDGTFLYGMTKFGGSGNGGVIFKVKPDGTLFSLVYNFSGAGLGLFPNSNFISDGTFLYATTTSGPGVNSCGTVFKIKKDGTSYTNLCSFTYGTGNRPWGGSLVSLSGMLYGLASFGNATVSCGFGGDGVVFKTGMATGIDENYNDNTYKVFPNPFNNYITLELTQINSDENYFIYDGFGREIRKGALIDTKTQIMLSELSPSLYTIRVPSKNITFRILKE